MDEKRAQTLGEKPDNGTGKRTYVIGGIFNQST